MKKARRILAVWILLAALPMARLSGATDVSGSVSGVWTPAGSPYKILGQADVQAGATLTIESGTAVEGGSLRIWGSVIAQGARMENRFIRFYPGCDVVLADCDIHQPLKYHGGYASVHNNRFHIANPYSLENDFGVLWCSGIASNDYTVQPARIEANGTLTGENLLQPTDGLSTVRILDRLQIQPEGSLEIAEGTVLDRGSIYVYGQLCIESATLANKDIVFFESCDAFVGDCDVATSLHLRGGQPIIEGNTFSIDYPYTLDRGYGLQWYTGIQNNTYPPGPCYVAVNASDTAEGLLRPCDGLNTFRILTTYTIAEDGKLNILPGVTVDGATLTVHGSLAAQEMVFTNQHLTLCSNAVSISEAAFTQPVHIYQCAPTITNSRFWHETPFSIRGTFEPGWSQNIHANLYEHPAPMLEVDGLVSGQVNWAPIKGWNTYSIAQEIIVEEAAHLHIEPGLRIVNRILNVRGRLNAQEAVFLNAEVHLADTAQGQIARCLLAMQRLNHCASCTVAISDNDLQHTTLYAWGPSDNVISLGTNYWGSPDSEWIHQHRIIDHHDEGSRPTVDIEPVLARSPVLPLPGDIDDSGEVDLADLITFSEHWSTWAPGQSADIAPPGGDNRVDLLDYALLAQHWLRTDD